MRMKRVTGKEFMEKTKYQYLPESDQTKELPQPPLEQAFNEGKQVIDLPKPEDLKIKKYDFLTAVVERKSMRKYSDEPLTLDELTYLLWTTQGVKQVTNRPATLRTVPSAGARHCLETYLLINRVEGLTPGLYRYKAIEHKLIVLDTNLGWDEKLTAACLGQPFVRSSAVTFFWAADAYRMEWRYGERGYRYMHLDAGHACQNLYLAAEVIDAGVCAIAAFNDDEVNPLLGLDGDNDFVVYVATVGKK